MSELRSYRESSTAALQDMKKSHFNLQEKFHKLVNKGLNTSSTEYKEKYNQPRDFNPILEKKNIKPASRIAQKHHKASQKKSKITISNELMPPSRENNINVNKENDSLMNYQTDNLSDAPSGESYETPIYDPDISSTEINDVSQIDFNKKVSTTEIRKEKRITESTAKFIKWPLQNQTRGQPPVDHDLIAHHSSAQQSHDWQSVQQSQMQAVNNLIIESKEKAGLSSVAHVHAPPNHSPGFFAWPGADEEVEKRVLTYSNTNVNSEYRDRYVANHPTSQIVHQSRPKDHQVIVGVSDGCTDESNWRSTAKLQMDESAHAMERDRENINVKSKKVAGLTSKTIAKHLSGREEDDPRVPVLFAWKVAADKSVPENVPFPTSRKNIHTETIDNYVNFPFEKTKRVKPPPDTIFINDSTGQSVEYQSEAKAQMLATQSVTDAAIKNGDVSGSTSVFLKKDYRKSYAPGYFAWPIPQQFPEISEECHENVHTEYRDNYVENKTGGGNVRVPAPEGNNVLGVTTANIDPQMWKSTAQLQMNTHKEVVSDKVAGASSAFLAKDSINLCPPGFFAWPIVPQIAQRSSGRNENALSEYQNNYGSSTSQLTRRGIIPPRDSNVIVGSVDAGNPAQWQSVANSQMEEALDLSSGHEDESSSERNQIDYRKSYAPDYFAWPVTDQKAQRTNEAKKNIHTEYRDSFNGLGEGVIRAPPPDNHIVFGSGSDDVNPANWKSTATVQNESGRVPAGRNGEQVVFKSDLHVSVSPNFFVWPKESSSTSDLKLTNTKRYGYGGQICSEYDSKFVDMNVKKVRSPIVKVTQTIPKSEPDSSAWQSTTKLDYDGGALNPSQSAGPTHRVEMPTVIDDRPMNFAWEPLPAKKYTPEKKNRSEKGTDFSTEYRKNFVDWTPALEDITEHKMASEVSNKNTVAPRKNSGVKFSGETEAHSKYKAWSPVGARHSRSPQSTPNSASIVRTQNTGVVYTSDFKDNVKSLISLSPNSSVSESHHQRNSSQKQSEDATATYNGQETADSALFSTDSLENSSRISSNSSRKWHASDDVHIRNNMSKLGLREDVAASARTARSMSAPTRRRPQYIPADSYKVNPILRNVRYPHVAGYTHSVNWATETSSQFSWKQ